jgi:hypothetical protein
LTLMRAKPPAAFKTRRDIACYFGGNTIECLICGRRFKRLHTHLAAKHGMAADDYNAIRRVLEPAEKRAATFRKVSGRSASDSGDSRDKIAAFAGVSGRTLEKIAAVCEAAEAEPKKFGKLAADMWIGSTQFNRTGTALTTHWARRRNEIGAPSAEAKAGRVQNLLQ